MSTTVNGHVVPQWADLRDTNKKQDWDRLETILTDACTAINTSGQLTDGIVFAGGMTLGGDVTATAVAVDVDLKDNDASAMSFDAAGKSGILNIDTQNAAEKVTMSGGCDVTGTLAAAGAATVGTTLGVTGALTAAAAATVGTTLGVTGVTTLSEELKTAKNVGAAQTGTTAVEYGNGRQHVTVLTVSTTLGAIAGGADLGLGKKVYVFPAGAVIVKSAYISMALDESDGNITADTPDVGLGTVVASGAVNVLGGTGTFEDILTGRAAADCNATATVGAVVNQILSVATGGAHDVFFNVADGWAASGETACPIAGTIVLEWVFVA